MSRTFTARFTALTLTQALSVLIGLYCSSHQPQCFLQESSCTAWVPEYSGDWQPISPCFISSVSNTDLQKSIHVKTCARDGAKSWTALPFTHSHFIPSHTGTSQVRMS